MPKSSLSSTARKAKAAKQTKKRHQRDGLPENDDDDALPDRKPTKKSKKTKEQRKKEYIAPVKPKGAVDPVESLNLAATDLDPSALVFLRRFNKKDEKTLFKALEEYKVWLSDGQSAEHVQLSLSVWLFHFAKFAIHPSRRIRSILAVELGQFWLDKDQKSTIMTYLLQNIDALAHWALLCHDIEPAVSLLAADTWQNALSTQAVSLDDISTSLIDFLTAMPQFPHLSGREETTDASEVEGDLSLASMTSQTASPQAVGGSEEEEDAQSRTTRLLVGIVGVLTTLLASNHPFQDIIDNDAFWELIGSNPFTEEGTLYLPSVRKTAWAFLAVLLSGSRQIEKDTLDSIGTHALFTALYEDSILVQNSVWPAMVLLFKNIWQTANAAMQDDDQVSSAASDNDLTFPPVLEAVRHFVGKICPGNPALNYPVILVLLSSPSLQSVIATGSAYPSALLDKFDQGNLTSAKLAAFAEALLFFGNRADASQREQLIEFYTPKAWQWLVADRNRQPTNPLSLLEFIYKLQGLSEPLSTSACKSIVTAFSLDLEPANIASHFAVISRCTSAKAIPNGEADVLRSITSSFVAVLCDAVVTTASSTNDKSLLALQSGWTSNVVWLDDESLLSYIPQFILDRLELARAAAEFFVAYTLHRNNEEQTSKLWIQVFQIIPAADSSIREDIIQKVTNDRIQLPSFLPSANLDHHLRQEINNKVLSDQAQALDEGSIASLASILSKPTHFVDSALPDEIMQLVSYQLSSQVNAYMQTPSRLFPSSRNLAHLCSHLSSSAHLFSPKSIQNSFDAAFRLTYLCFGMDDAMRQWGKTIWAGQSALSDAQRLRINTDLQSTITGLAKIGSTTSSPYELVVAWQALESQKPLVSIEDLREARQTVLSDPGRHSDSTSAASFLYIRLLVILLVDRTTSFNSLKQRSAAALDVLIANELLGRDPRLDAEMQAVTAVIRNAAASIQASTTDVTHDWHKSLFASASDSDGTLAQDNFTAEVAKTLTFPSLSYYARELVAVSVAKIVQQSLQYITDAPATAFFWLTCVPTMARKNPQLACQILKAVVPFLETGQHDRLSQLQNRYASDLSGIKAAAANDGGLQSLRLLNACAPGPNSNAPFLSQQRSIFLLQSIQNWIADDDAPDLADDTLAELVKLFSSMLPAIQTMSGRHWELIFDVLMEALEASDVLLGEHQTLPACLAFLSTLKELALANSSLRDLSKSGLSAADFALLHVFVEATAASRPRLLRDLACYISQSTVNSNLDERLDLPKLLLLLRHQDDAVRNAAALALDSLVSSKVADIIVEVETTEEEIEVRLPEQLIVVISHPPPDENIQSTLGFLLAWRTCCRYLAASSVALRSKYVNQLRECDAVSLALMPFLIQSFGLNKQSHAVDIQPWSIDEADFTDLEESDQAILLISANLYLECLRTLAAPIREYYEGLRNKQLSSALSTFTERLFSPLLIERELQPLREKATVDGEEPLTDENMTVRISSGVNEVKAIYSVDEQPMELSIRLPTNYPLSLVEIRDLKKVGVSDATWRAWIFAIRQVITSGNSRIVDALRLFKKNVSLHFEGVEPCSICYSVIALSDQRKPSQKCRTCKNIFHSGCLYKWFSTSHGSTCPLCRSLF